MMRALSLASFLLLASVSAESGPKFDAFEDGAHSFQESVAAMNKLDGQDKAAEASIKQLKFHDEKNAAKTKASIDDFAASLQGIPVAQTVAASGKVGRSGKWIDSSEALGEEIEARAGKAQKQHIIEKTSERVVSKPARSRVAAEHGPRDEEPAPLPTSTTAGPEAADKLSGAVESLNTVLGVQKGTPPAQWMPTALHPARPKNQHSNKAHFPTMKEEKKHAAALKLKLKLPAESHPHRLTAAHENVADRPFARSSVVAQKLAAKPAVASSAAPAIPAHQAAPGRVTYDSRRKAWVSEANPRQAAAAPIAQAEPQAASALKKGCHWGDIFC